MGRHVWWMGEDMCGGGGGVKDISMEISFISEIENRN